MPAITCTRGHARARAYSRAVAMPRSNSASRPGRDASPRSPASQSPAGALNSAWVSPAERRAAATSAAGYSYGKRYSTPVKPASAAAAKRSRKGRSVNIMLRFAANCGIGGSSVSGG